MYRKDTFVIPIKSDFICSRILFQIGTLRECRVRLEKYDFYKPIMLHDT